MNGYRRRWMIFVDGSDGLWHVLQMEQRPVPSPIASRPAWGIYAVSDRGGTIVEKSRSKALLRFQIAHPTEKLYAIRGMDGYVRSAKLTESELEYWISEVPLP